MEQLTFLRPDNPYPSHCSKSFSPGNPPVKIRDYSLGKHFTVETVFIEDLEDLLREFRLRPADWIRIAGQPVADLPKPTTRTKDNFPERESTLIMLDMDKWQIPGGWAWDFTSPTSIHSTVKTLLRSEGFGFLADTQFLCLLTASQFSTTQISCHLYYMVSMPVSIVVMREWCSALQKYRGRTLFDPATQRSVQPDYIARRDCQGFEDPLPEFARLSLCSQGPPTIEFATLQEQIQKDCALAGWNVGEEPRKAIGHTWDETVKLAGQEGQGINEVCYRAAAQMVQQYGQRTVQDSLSHYATLLHTETWKALKLNDPWLNLGRDKTADVQTYNEARFKQYLSSALSKSFGSPADDSRQILASAIEATRNGVVKALFDMPVMEAYVALQRRHPALYAEVRSEIKLKLRGIVSIVDFDSTVRKSVLHKEKGDSGFANFDEIGGDNQYIQQVIAAFDWLEDEYGQRYAGWNGEASRYRIIPAGNSLTSVLYAKGMELSSGAVSGKFGPLVLMYHTGKEGLASGGKNSLFQKAQVGMRVYPVGGPYSQDTTTWIHLGPQPSGVSLCAKVSAGNVEIVEEYDSPIRWRTSDDSAPIPVATRKEIEDRIGGIEALKDWTRDALPRYFNVHEEERSTLLGILFALMTGRGASPLIEFCGPPGSGKSTAADLLLDLIDPTPGGLHSGDGRGDLTSVKRDQIINVVSQRYLTFFDNVSRLDVDTQDTLCKIATGASKDERLLYVGTYYKISAKRPVVLTSLSPVVTRPDLASRTESLNFSSHHGFAIPPEALYEEWKRDRPYLFMGLLYLLSDMLSMKDTVKIEDGVDARRKWMVLADYIFYSEDEIQNVREKRKIEKSKSILENDDFSMAFLGYLQHREDEGEEYLEMRTLDLYQEYCEWIEGKAGERLVLRMKGGGVVRWKVRNIYERVIPKSISGFGWNISKISNVLQDVSGWIVNGGEKKRISGGNVRVMYKKIDIEDL
jgi:ABC-type oligopeptide transport system ATPase subunit